MKTLILCFVLICSTIVNAADFQSACRTYEPLDLKKLTLLDGTIIDSAKDRKKLSQKQLEVKFCECAHGQFSTGMFIYLKNNKFSGNESAAWDATNKFMKDTNFTPDTIKNFLGQNPDAQHGCVKELGKKD